MTKRTGPSSAFAVLEPDGIWSAAFAAAFLVSAGLAYSLGLVWPLTVSLAAALLYLTAYDLKYFLLPDSVTLPLVLIGLLNVFWQPVPLTDRLAGGVAGFLVIAGIGAIYQGLRGRAGIGLGDAKLLAAAGTWLGWMALPFLVLVASVTALIAAGIVYGYRRFPMSEIVIPFGPFLALGFLVLWLYRVGDWMAPG